MSLSKEQQQFTIHIGLLIAYADSIGVGLTFGEAHRTRSQQYLYYYGKAVDLVSGKLIDAKIRSRTMKSNHLKRLAVDFNFFIDGDLFYEHEKIDLLGIFWVNLDDKNRWGGNFNNFKDTPHFERNY